MKRFAVALLFCLSLCLSLLLTGCGQDNAPCTHEHISDWIYDTQATCQKQGVRHKECLDCGKIITTESYHSGHEYENGVCKICGRAQYDEQYYYQSHTVGDVEGYIITGLGYCKSAKLSVPETHNGKPVLAIGDRVFKDQADITYVFIPKTVVSVGDEAFRNCAKLETVTFAAGSACTTIGNNAFCDCPALTKFEVPQGVTRLSNGLFSGDAALEDLLLHDGITAVGVETFEGCASLFTIEKNGMAYLGNGDNHYFLLLKVTDKTATALTPEPGLKIVGSYAFTGCRSLTALTLPTGVISLSDYAVSGCTALQNVQLPDSLVTIGAHAFAGCTSLTHIDLPQHLFGIGDCAFSDCTVLSSITLPASLRALGSAVFTHTAVTPTEVGGLCYLGSADNPYFALVDIADKAVATLSPHADVKLIAGSALSGCTALTTVTLPAGLFGIGAAAFSNCGALSSVAATGSVTVADQIEDTPVPLSLDSPAAWAEALTGAHLYRYWFLQ